MNLSTNIIVACCTRKLYVVRVVSQCTLCQWLMVLDVFCYQTLYTFYKNSNVQYTIRSWF